MKKYYNIDEINELRKTKIILLCKKKIYDVTNFVDLHPGNNIILKHINNDNTINYKFHSKKAKKLWDSFLIGYFKK